MTTAVAVAGCTAASIACAAQALDEVWHQAGRQHGNETRGTALVFDAGNRPFSLLGRNIPASRLSTADRKVIYGYAGTLEDVGTSLSYTRLLPGITDTARFGYWLDPDNYVGRGFTVGYAWRALSVEGSAYASPQQREPTRPPTDTFGLAATATRLSYELSPNLSFHFSRGTLSGLDQLAPDEEVRRVAVSATYRRAFANSNWHSTLAWGRNVRKSREPTMGYLLESTLRFNGAHSVFGRLEQVGSGELAAESGAAQSRAFKLNRLTFGYFREVDAPGAIKLDAGAFISRYFVPSSASTTYRDEPASVVLFVRLNLR